MILSKTFREEMDKITVSDELKAKILKSAEQKIKAEKTKSIHSKTVYFRYAKYAAACAACLVLCLTAVNNTDVMDILPTKTETPSYVTPTTSPIKTSETVTEKETPQVAEQEVYETNKKTENYVLPTGNASSKIETVASNVAEQDNAVSTVNDTENTTVYLPDITPPKSEMPVLSSGNNTETNTDDIEDELVCGGSPFVDYSSIDELKKQVGYNFKIPKYMPSGYKTDNISLMFEKLIRISYTNDTDTIIYRTEKTDEDISGDYNVYEKTETEQINDNTVTMKSSDDKYYVSTWNDESSYSVSSSDGIEKEEMKKIIENVDYPQSEDVQSDTSDFHMEEQNNSVDDEK